MNWWGQREAPGVGGDVSLPVTSQGPRKYDIPEMRMQSRPGEMPGTVLDPVDGRGHQGETPRRWQDCWSETRGEAEAPHGDMSVIVGAETRS